MQVSAKKYFGVKDGKWWPLELFGYTITIS